MKLIIAAIFTISLSATSFADAGFSRLGSELMSVESLDSMVECRAQVPCICGGFVWCQTYSASHPAYFGAGNKQCTWFADPRMGYVRCTGYQQQRDFLGRPYWKFVQNHAQCPRC